jgi:tetratricopeptide (TPR) repeat protein
VAKPAESWEKRVAAAAELLGLPQQLPSTSEELDREALQICERLMEDLPDRPEAIAVGAMYFNRQGRHQEAEALWKKALEINANFAPAYANLGWLAARQEDLGQAIEYLRKAIALDPLVGQPHSLLVDVLLRQNQLEQALAAARQYVATFPRAGDSNYWLGQALLQLGRLEEAKKAHLAAIQYDPNYTAAYHSLSIICRRLGQREEARRYQEKFAELKEKEMEADRQRTRQFHQLSFRQRSTAQYHLAAGNVQAAFGTPEKAEAHWIRGVAVAPHALDCRLALADFYEKQNRLWEAREQWQAITDNPAAVAGHWFRRGELEKRLGLFADAEACYRKAAELAPQAIEPLEALVDLAVHYGHKMPDAEQLAQKAVELSPTPQNFFSLSALRESSGDLQGALAALEEALRREPTHPLLRVAYEELKNRQAGSSGARRP